ncbi:DUF317 domain-containing protein [Kitasatospora sp. LaBMicrA B282]|uniref:DUF317 domain-containing protein n=1 Tax=Kitasatospora sp. LaBMicrA B282 TaxID=3420949 RepID=UPI003D0F138E
MTSTPPVPAAFVPPPINRLDLTPKPASAGSVSQPLAPGTQLARQLSITPRFLAGAGEEEDAPERPLAESVMTPLADAGWHVWADEVANMHVTSPCGRAYFGFLPEENPEPVGIWKAWVRPDHYGPRTWMATFSDDLPYEFVRAFTARWAAEYRPDDPAFAEPDDGHRDGIERVLTVLREAGWDRDPTTGIGHAVELWTAPGGLAGLELRVRASGGIEREILGGVARWAVWAAPAPYRRRLWAADFSTSTPTGLIAAFCQAVVDPIPLIREEHQIPRICRDVVTRA